MMGMREHIDRLHGFTGDVCLGKEFKISSHRDRIAGDIDNFYSIILLHLYKEVDNVFMESFSWRINDY